MSVPVRHAYRFYRWIWAGIDWLYPPSCGGCGGNGERWCADCQQAARVITAPFCSHCGKPWLSGDECSSCRNAHPSFSALRSWALFDGPVRNALHRLKYHRDIALGERLAVNLIETLQKLDWSVELVIPVPLGVARLRERGYNQAALLARPLALACGLRYEPNALNRIKETRSQVGLTAPQRKANMAHAFQGIPEKVRGQHVLVVDDVATSCATLDACAQALLACGAAKVYCLTLARAE